MDRESSFAPSTTSYESTSVSGLGASSRMSTDPSQASSATIRGNPMKQAVRTQKAPPPLPFYSQAIICQGMVYCSGSIGVSPVTKQIVEGGVGDRTAQALNNLSAVLEEAGSSLRYVVKCNVFLSDMTNFAAMNRVYDTFFDDPKPCRTCVAVSELPLKTDVEIECIAHLAKAKETRKRAKRNATPADSGYGGSDESWQPSYREDAETLHRSEDSAIRTKGTRGSTPKIQGSSTPKRATNAEHSNLVNDFRITRKSPAKGSPKKKRRIDTPPSDEEIDTLMSPVDLQLQSETLANIPELRKEPYAHSTFNEKDYTDYEMERALDYFANPRNRSNQDALEDYFASLPERPKSDAVYRNRYQALKSAAWDWAKEYFSDAPESSPPLNLMHLATASPVLMDYINATTSSPQSGDWEQLFQMKRPEMVYSILGKVLEMHVFGTELFGATPEQEAVLRSKDYEMLDSD
ncbi:MAG: hypothetical protein Q9225_007642, partial [Loekoesia sp. 1 TL-2023]